MIANMIKGRGIVKVLRRGFSSEAVQNDIAK